MAEFKNILNLMGEVVPEALKYSMEEVIELNSGKMDLLVSQIFNAELGSVSPGLAESELKNYSASPELLFSKDKIELITKNDDLKKNQSDQIKIRIQVLKFMIRFRAKENLEMLDLTKFRQIVDPQILKIMLSRSKFVNFTIQEKQTNDLLGLQGYYLKNFIYFHMRADMKFKALIDSSTIDMDNPYTRNTIREENRNDGVIGKKYIEQIDVENMCLSLLEKFFPDIAGIWADHSHFMPQYIIEFIKICFEMGLILPSFARKILISLQKITVSLIKLEEAWLDRLNEVSKLSDMLKANNVTNHFAKCRENMAYLLIQIMVLLADEAFLKDYPVYVDNMNHHQSKKHLYKLGIVDAKGEPKFDNFVKNFMFFEKEVNDPLLFITMNYLSSTVYISLQKGMSPNSRMAIERIFLYLTTTNRDAFLNSLKQVKGEDLKFFDKVDVIQPQARQLADDLGNTMRKLLELIGKSAFDRTTGAMNNSNEQDKGYTEFLKPYVPLDFPTLTTIVRRIISFIEENATKYKDFYNAIVKESVPLAFLALVNYINDYFPEELREVNKEIFNFLFQISYKNNYSKAQIFKGDSLYHLRKLLNRPDKYTYLFLSRLCTEDNIAFYLGRDLFGEIIHIFEKFNKTVAKEVFGFLEKDKNRKFNKEEEFPHFSLGESCAIFILMTKIVTKIFSKPFLNEREKLQNSMVAQEAIYPTLCRFYLPKMLELLHDPELKNLSESNTQLLLPKRLFLDESETELIGKLEKIELDSVNKKILLLNVCFNLFKSFNTVCRDGISHVVLSEVSEVMGKLPEDQKQSTPFENEDSREEVDLLSGKYSAHQSTTVLGYFTSPISSRKRPIEPLGLDSEMLTFIRIFALNPEEHCIIESTFDFNNLNPNKYNRRFLKKCFSRAEYLSEQKNDQEEARLFLLEGLFPTLYRMLKSLRNQSELRVKGNQQTGNSEMVKYIMKKLNASIPAFNEIAGKNIVEEDEFTVHPNPGNKLSERDQKESGRSFIPKRVGSAAGVDKGKDKKAGEGQDSAHSKDARLVEQCDAIIAFLKKYYEEIESQPDSLRQFMEGLEITQERYIELVYAAKFQETLEPDLAARKQILNAYIKMYQEAKELYFERPEEPNLMSYFDRNLGNLRGVFNSCVDRMLGRNKLEKQSTTSGSLAYDYSISRFWMSPPCFAYINMLQRVLTKSKTARRELYSFFLEDVEEQKVENEAVERNNYSLSSIVTRPRNNLLSVLLRIHTDLVVFLNSNPSLTSLWWIIHDIYGMLNLFFQNLCECNFMEFKEYIGSFVPKLTDPGWELLEGRTGMEVFVAQLDYLLSSCKLAKNRDAEMVHSDQISKMQPLLDPLVDVINEAITGPCRVNQLALMQGQLDGLISLSTRIVNELDHQYNELVDSCVTLLLSMCEGYDEQILKTLALKIPSSILVDRIFRVTKKVYIKELIKSGKFERLARKKAENQIEDEFELAEKSHSSKVRTVKEKADKNEKAAQAQTAIREKEMKEQILANQDIIKKVLAKQLDENGEEKFVINEEMEAMVEIEDWEDLFDLYMNRQDFGESRQFHYIFKIMILWQNLASSSKNHKSRFEDAKYETEQYFKEIDLFSFAFATEKVSKSAKVGAEKKKSKPPEFSCIFYFISNKIMTEIELVNPTGKPVLVYFPKSPPCFMLSDEAKRSYREECQIADSNTKMLEIMKNFNLFNVLMQRDLQTWRSLGFFFRFLSADAFKKVTFCCWIIGVVINIIIAVSIKISEDGFSLEYKSDRMKNTVRIMGYMLVGISSLFLSIWMVFKYKQTYLTRLEDYLFDHPGVSRNSLRARLYVAIFPAFISQSFPMNYFGHILFSVLGIEYSIFLMALNLMLIVNISKTTKFVLTSITLHLDQLTQTLVLAIFVIYAYSMIMGNVLLSQVGSQYNAPCARLSECFFFTVNLGLRNGGGIAESLEVVQRDTRFNTRSVFDVTFFMLVNVISLNIVFGIIIDTFSQLRDEQNERSRPYFIQHSTRRTTASFAGTRGWPSARWP